MNIRSVVFFVFALLCAVANAQIQADLNDDACKAYQEADKKLNAIYQRLLEQHKDDANLRKAQRVWLVFRDAEMEAALPTQGRSSSRFPDIFCWTPI